jgi:hypothetical protein
MNGVLRSYLKRYITKFNMTGKKHPFVHICEDGGAMPTKYVMLKGGPI